MTKLRPARVVAACVLMSACFGIMAVGFFGGFSTFRVGLMLMREPLHPTRARPCPSIPAAISVNPPGADICGHAIGGILLSFVVITKAHYGWIWQIFGFFRSHAVIMSHPTTTSFTPNATPLTALSPFISHLCFSCFLLPRLRHHHDRSRPSRSEHDPLLPRSALPAVLEGHAIAEVLVFSKRRW